jgi:hypothetical protein
MIKWSVYTADKKHQNVSKYELRTARLIWWLITRKRSGRGFDYIVTINKMRKEK